MTENKKALVTEDSVPMDIISQNNGFVKLFRDIEQWEWYTEPNTMRLFIHCLIKANHATKKWRGTEVHAGSFITSYSKLAQDLKLSEQNIRTSLKRLKSTGELTHTTNSQYSRITVNNWDKFQQINMPANTQLTGDQQTTNRQLTTNKNDKNEKNEKKYILLRNIYKRENFSEILTQEWQDLISEWLDYKKGKKQSYKTEKPIIAFIEKLLVLSNRDYTTAKAIINESMANNWNGIFELKNQTNRQKEKKNATYNPCL